MFITNSRASKALLTLAGLICPFFAGIAAAATQEALPVATPDAASIDQMMTGFMQLTGATAGTIAINRGGKIVFSRACGYSDRRQRVPARISTTMRLASCTKPVTRAAVETLIQQGKLRRDMAIFDYLGIPPASRELPDPRVTTITIGQLLNHTGGWDRDTTFDPLYRTDEIGRTLGVGQIRKHHIVKYMWSQPLQSDPGTEEHYSNFGYLLLGLAIEKATGQSYIESVRQLIGEPLGIGDFSISSPSRSARTQREVFYSNENGLNLKLRDSASGLVSSAPSLCKFMSAWWIDGTPRNGPRNEFLFQTGTHPLTTTTIMEQRMDGIDYALLLNARREDTYARDNAQIREEVNGLLDRMGTRLGN